MLPQWSMVTQWAFSNQITMAFEDTPRSPFANQNRLMHCRGDSAPTKAHTPWGIRGAQMVTQSPLKCIRTNPPNGTEPNLASRNASSEATQCFLNGQWSLDGTRHGIDCRHCGIALARSMGPWATGPMGHGPFGRPAERAKRAELAPYKEHFGVRWGEGVY